MACEIRIFVARTARRGALFTAVFEAAAPIDFGNAWPRRLRVTRIPVGSSIRSRSAGKSRALPRRKRSQLKTSFR